MFSVLVVGAPGVGKKTLTQETTFSTSWGEVELVFTFWDSPRLGRPDLVVALWDLRRPDTLALAEERVKKCPAWAPVVWVGSHDDSPLAMRAERKCFEANLAAASGRRQVLGFILRTLLGGPPPFEFLDDN